LRASQGGTILNTITANVIAFSGLQPITLGWTINPGTGYRLELASGSVPLYYNSFGATYPYTFAGSSVSITGYFNPTPASGSFYYFFYNWQITEGCKSNRVPVTGVVNTPPSVPVINTNGTTLSSTSPTGNQWYLNGNIIPGATGVSHNMALTGAGTYTVVVTDANGCSTSSLPYLYTGVFENLQAAGISMYPVPAKDVLHVNLASDMTTGCELQIYNSLGAICYATTLHQTNNKIDISGLAPGSYMVELKVKGERYSGKLSVTSDK
jgi:hypothetical protein